MGWPSAGSLPVRWWSTPLPPSPMHFPLVAPIRRRAGRHRPEVSLAEVVRAVANLADDAVESTPPDGRVPVAVRSAAATAVITVLRMGAATASSGSGAGRMSPRPPGGASGWRRSARRTGHRGDHRRHGDDGHAHPAAGPTPGPLGVVAELHTGLRAAGRARWLHDRQQHLEGDVPATAPPGRPLRPRSSTGPAGRGRLGTLARGHQSRRRHIPDPAAGRLTRPTRQSGRAQPGGESAGGC